MELWDKILIQDQVRIGSCTHSAGMGEGKALQELSWRSRPENHRDPAGAWRKPRLPSTSAVYLRGDGFSVTAESIL